MKRIVIDARLIGYSSGGIETVLRGLIEGFKGKEFKNLEIIIVLNRWTKDLECEVINTSLSFVHDNHVLSRMNEIEKNIKFALRALVYLTGIKLPRCIIFPRDKFIESLRPDILHLPFQSVNGAKVPIIYQPHDLQHKHLPQYFSFIERFKRNVNYSVMTNLSAKVVVTSKFVMQDLMDKLHLENDKIRIIQLAPLLSLSSGSTSKLGEEVTLEKQTFLLYPAVNWPHKNHNNLLQAISNLKKYKNIEVRLVLTGYVNEKYEDPKQTAYSMGIQKQIVVLGHVSNELLDFLYSHSEGVVVPTKFEAASFPIWEAFSRSKPVACSNVTSLPEQVGGAALLFDPDEIIQIESAIEILWTDQELRRNLGSLGKSKLDDLSWAKTAEQYVSLYSELLNSSQTDQTRN